MSLDVKTGEMPIDEAQPVGEDRLSRIMGPSVVARRSFNNNGHPVLELIFRLPEGRKRLAWVLIPGEQREVRGRANPFVYVTIPGGLSGEDDARDAVKAEFSRLHPEGSRLSGEART